MAKAFRKVLDIREETTIDWDAYNTKLRSVKIMNIYVEDWPSRLTYTSGLAQATATCQWFGFKLVWKFFLCCKFFFLSGRPCKSQWKIYEIRFMTQTDLDLESFYTCWLSLCQTSDSDHGDVDDFMHLSLQAPQFHFHVLPAFLQVW